MPVFLPSAGVPEAQNALPEPVNTKREKSKKPETPIDAEPVRSVRGQFGTLTRPVAETVKEKLKAMEQQKPKTPAREKVKVDPVHLAKARELRDKYLEQFNAGVLADGNGVLPGGKYEVARALPVHDRKMLAA